MRNTIVAGNSALQFPDCSGPAASGGYNLLGSTDGCTFTPATGDLTGADPRLAAPVGRPGRPSYRPLLPGSPAIDAGNPAGCQGNAGPLTADMRGVTRQGRCDIGAYEFIAPGPGTLIYAYDGTPQPARPSHCSRSPCEAPCSTQTGRRSRRSRLRSRRLRPGRLPPSAALPSQPSRRIRTGSLPHRRWRPTASWDSMRSSRAPPVSPAGLVLAREYAALRCLLGQRSE